MLALILLALVAARSGATPITEDEAARYADALSGDAAPEATASPAHVGSDSAGGDAALVDDATRDALGELVAGDDDLDLDALDAGLGFSSATFSDPAELRDLRLRPRRSRWGRLELAVAWRRAWRGSAAAATTAASVVDDALFLFATWRR